MVTTKNVVLADWLFTTLAIVVQLITGLWLTEVLGIPFGSLWFVLATSLFVFVGLCWVPVVWIQIKMKSAIDNGVEFDEFAPLLRVWIVLGVLAFLSMVFLYALMVSKYARLRFCLQN